MKNAKTNFHKAISMLLTLMIIVSSFALALTVSAVSITEDENIFTSLTNEGTENYEFTGPNNSTGYLSATNAREVPGVAAALNTGNVVYSRKKSNNSSDYAIYWKECVKNKSGFIFGKTGTHVGNGVSNAYVLEDNTTYEISYDYLNSDGTALTLNIIGVNAAANVVLQDKEDEYTYTVYDDVLIDETAASKSWTTYTSTFTTGTVGADKYLAFAIFRDSTTSLTFRFDNFKIHKVTTIDANDVITFNDNGKTYYAYPDALATLPEGDNGPLNSKFLGWVDADGNAVTEVPAAGTVLNATYPVTDTIPDKTTELVLSLNDDVYGGGALGGDACQGVYGVTGVSNSSHKIYSRSVTRPDGETGYALKWSSSTAALSCVNFGIKDAPLDETLANTYALKDNATYSVSFYIYHSAGAGVSASLIATTDRKQTTGTQLGSAIEFAAVNKKWVQYTVDFTTETLGDNKYLTFLMSNPSNVSLTIWLSTVSITETCAGTVADCITFVDGEDTFYAAPNALEALPEGVNAPEGDDFLGWVDAEGNAVTEIPAAGTVLTAKYGAAAKIIATSIRYESGEGETYKSAGIRFRSRLDIDSASKAAEIGFIAVPTSFLNGMTLAEYANSEGNVAIKAKVKGEDMNEIIYKPNVEDGGKVYNHYQLIISGLTREGVTENLLDTEISTAMYMIIDGQTVYTDTVAYSYNDVTALMNK